VGKVLCEDRASEAGKQKKNKKAENRATSLIFPEVRDRPAPCVRFLDFSAVREVEGLFRAKSKKAYDAVFTLRLSTNASCLFMEVFVFASAVQRISLKRTLFGVGFFFLCVCMVRGT